MYRIPVRKIVGWLAGAVGIVALVLPGAGTAAAEEHMPGPTIHTRDNPPYGSTPFCVAVKWDPPMAIGEDIDGYTVTRLKPGHDFKDVAENREAPMCGLDPETTATFKVCAVYISEEDDATGCSQADLSTTKADVGSMEPQGPLPVPRVDEPLSRSLKDFGVGWKGFYDYDFYHINIRPEGGKLWSIKHDDDGDWGWQRVDGLTAGTTYHFSVEGCVSGIFGDPCSGFGPEATVTIEGAYGPDTCKPGFVWRDAVAGDHICVTPERRQKVADDLNTAKTRTQPSSGNPAIDLGTAGGVCPLKRQGEPMSPECWEAMRTKCLDGFVNREIPGENVVVCVDQKEADLLKQENANPTANRVQP